MLGAEPQAIGNLLELLDDILVIGNGESRLSIDLECLLKKYTSVGCNAVYRDHCIDHLVCVDRRMVKESKPFHNNIYTRKDWNQSFGVSAVPELPYQGNLRHDDPFHWGSGPYAVLLAASFSETIHMVGFDLYSKNKQINNVYKGTQNYNKVDYRAVDHSYWVYQISKVFEHYPDKYFVVYNYSTWEMPVIWKLKNVSHKSLDFLKN